MEAPDFIEYEDLEAYHKEALAMDPESADGVLDENLLRGALGSAENQFYYYAEGLDEAEGYAYLAAHYWTRVAQNHGYRDANNRTAFLCARGFLNTNGYDLDIPASVLKEIGRAIAERVLDCESLSLILAPRLIAVSR